MKTKEKGITLVALVITIILITILTSMGYIVGNSTIKNTKFTQYKSELKIMQSKVNELNQENKTDIGQELTDNQKSILDKQEISNIIYNGKKKEEKTKIQNGFRYFSKNYINTEFNLDSVEREYLINVEYCYVICPDGFTYDGVTYYMIDQIDGEVYNVRYNDKNEKSGSFDVNTTKENNKYKVEITNIQYNGYVDKWEVKYKLEDSSYWETSDSLSFYVKDAGTYIINVVHGDEIDLGQKIIEVLPVYATSNLILNYDAINNISETDHSTDTTIWKDLSKNKNDAQITGATWEGNYLSFDGVDDFAKTTFNVNYEGSCAVTVQFVLKGSLTPNLPQMIVESSENWNQNHASYGIDFNEYGINNINTTFHSDSLGYNIKRTEDNVVSDSDINVFTVVINNYNKCDSFIKVYKNGEILNLYIVNEHLNQDISNIKFENYIMYIASRAGSDLFSKMKLGALRVYNRELDQNEVQDSYELDSRRYN